jgi:hypothetical protein
MQGGTASPATDWPHRKAGHHCNHCGFSWREQTEDEQRAIYNNLGLGEFEELGLDSVDTSIERRSQ